MVDAFVEHLRAKPPDDDELTANDAIAGDDDGDDDDGGDDGDDGGDGDDGDDDDDDYNHSGEVVASTSTCVGHGSF